MKTQDCGGFDQTLEAGFEHVYRVEGCAEWFEVCFCRLRRPRRPIRQRPRCPKNNFVLHASPPVVEHLHAERIAHLSLATSNGLRELPAWLWLSQAGEAAKKAVKAAPRAYTVPGLPIFGK